MSEFTGQVIELIELFKPFTHDHDLHFRCDNIRALQRPAHPRTTRQALRWDPEAIDWRNYWMDTHFAGLQKWVFPVLDDEFGPKPRSVYTYKDLLELFDATTKLHRHRVALRLLPAHGDEDDREPVVYTYGRVQDMATQGAGSLRERGVAPGDRVMLMSENRPQWGISYFAILTAGATAVPVDEELTHGRGSQPGCASRAPGRSMRLAQGRRARPRRMKAWPCRSATRAPRAAPAPWRRSPAPVLIDALGRQIAAAGLEGVQVVALRRAPGRARRGSAAPCCRRRKGDAVASLIFTSGTTGHAQGRDADAQEPHVDGRQAVVACSGSTSTTACSRVLPLHHTFEFSAGFLMPLMHGASITYLEELDADTLSRRLRRAATSPAWSACPRCGSCSSARSTRHVTERGVLSSARSSRSSIPNRSAAREDRRSTSAPASCCSSPCTASSAAACAC